MTSRDLFGMLLRVLGIWLILNALQTVAFPLFFMLNATSQTTVINGLFYGIAPPGMGIICGCFLLFYTDWFVQVLMLGSEDRAIGMSAPDLFGVFARTIGVWEIAQGLGQLVLGLREFRQYTNEQEFVDMVTGVFCRPGIHIAMGLLLLFGTGWLVRISYRDRATVTTDYDGKPLAEDDEQRQDGERQDET